MQTLLIAIALQTMIGVFSIVLAVFCLPPLRSLPAPVNFTSLQTLILTSLLSKTQTKISKLKHVLKSLWKLKKQMESKRIAISFLIFVLQTSSYFF